MNGNGSDQAGNEVRVCRDCGVEFELTMSDRQFYRERDLALPRRCKPCRARKRAARIAEGNERGWQ